MKGNSEFRIRNSERGSGEGRKFRIKNEELKKIRIQRGEEAKKGELRMKGNSEFGGKGEE